MPQTRANGTISVIVCSRDADRAARMEEHYRHVLADEPLELLTIIGPRSLCEGYNRGLRRSTGELIVFSHDDIEFLIPDLGRRLRGHLQEHDLIGVAGTTRLVGPGWVSAGPPHILGQVAHPVASGGYSVCLYGMLARAVGQVQALDGLFLACRRYVAESVPFDETLFDGFHLYDVDFTFRAYQWGFRLAVVPDIPLIHASGGNYGEAWRQYAERFVNKYAGQLATVSGRRWRFGTVQVRSREEAREVMRPDYLNP